MDIALAMRSFRHLAAAALAAVSALTVASCSSSPRPAASCCSSGARVEEPDLAAGAGGDPVAVWGAVSADGAADIVLARLDAPSGWSAPVRVQPRAGTAVAGRQVGPRIARSPDGALAVAWIDRDRDDSGDILLGTSSDGGRTFSSPVRVNDDHAGGHGQEYVDVAGLPDGRFAVVWLDERDAPAGEENRKQVYLAESDIGARSFSANLRLTSSPRGVCPCCRPAIAAGTDGSLHVIYRDRDGERLFVRVLTRPAGEADFLAPATLSAGWSFPGCPVNGPAIAAGPRGDLWALWMERDALWWSCSRDGGRTFPAARRVPSAAEGPAAPVRVALAALPDGAAAAWEDGTGTIWSTVFSGDGRSVEPPRRLAGGDDVIARSPVVAVSGNICHVVWVEEDLAAALAPGAAIAEGLPRHVSFELSSGTLTGASRGGTAAPAGF